MVDERQSGRTGRGGQEGMSAAELAEAISRARGGNADAWGELYRLYAAPIFRFCRRALPSREDAEDATMEIFVKLREKLGQYDPGRPFTACSSNKNEGSYSRSGPHGKSAEMSLSHSAQAGCAMKFVVMC